jgi:hypothetical protein
VTLEELKDSVLDRFLDMPFKPDPRVSAWVEWIWRKPKRPTDPAPYSRKPEAS